jgi:hypothetical protein
MRCCSDIRRKRDRRAALLGEISARHPCEPYRSPLATTPAPNATATAASVGSEGYPPANVRPSRSSSNTGKRTNARPAARNGWRISPPISRALSHGLRIRRDTRISLASAATARAHRPTSGATRVRTFRLTRPASRSHAVARRARARRTDRRHRRYEGPRAAFPAASGLARRSVSGDPET